MSHRPARRKSNAPPGDSGGPLMFNKVQASDPVSGQFLDDRVVGITSWGDGCGQAGRLVGGGPHILEPKP